MRTALPFLLITIVGTPAVHAQAPLADEPDPVSALQHGKASLSLRTRYERVDDQGSGKTADALTNRLALGYRSGEWKGLFLSLEAENIAALGTPLRYFVPQTGDGNPGRAVVADPPGSRMSQLYLGWKGLKVGRQTLDLDNQRFIGSVAWRQFGQSFTGASFTNTTWIPRTALTFARFTQVQTIVGTTRDLRMDVANVRVGVWPGGHLGAFRYAVEETVAPATSFVHTGLRLDGEAKGILYEVSYAAQRRFRDATVSGTADANYRYLGLGYAFTPAHNLVLAQESLEPGFKTPYATLHAWNGWADRFLVTPTNGLVDRFARYRGKVGAWSFEGSYHAFSAQAGGAAYGREADASVEYAVATWLKVLLKGADYRADAATTTLGTPNRNLSKLWVQTTLIF